MPVSKHRKKKGGKAVRHPGRAALRGRNIIADTLYQFVQDDFPEGEMERAERYFLSGDHPEEGAVCVAASLLSESCGLYSTADIIWLEHAESKQHGQAGYMIRALNPERSQIEVQPFYGDPDRDGIGRATKPWLIDLTHPPVDFELRPESKTKAEMDAEPPEIVVKHLCGWDEPSDPVLRTAMTELILDFWLDYTFLMLALREGPDIAPRRTASPLKPTDSEGRRLFSMVMIDAGISKRVALSALRQPVTEIMDVMRKHVGEIEGDNKEFDQFREAILRRLTDEERRA